MSNIFLEHEKCLLAGIPGCLDNNTPIVKEEHTDPDMEYVEGCKCPFCSEFKYANEEEEKERTMYAQANSFVAPIAAVVQQETYDPLKYIIYRLEDIRDKKINKLREKFGLQQKSPKSAKELKEWLEKKYYYIDSPYKDDEQECWANSFFYWGEKPDKEGYKKAKESLDASYYAVIDTVKIKTDEDTRLQALKDFENTQP